MLIHVNHFDLGGKCLHFDVSSQPRVPSNAPDVSLSNIFLPDLEVLRDDIDKIDTPKFRII